VARKPIGKQIRVQVLVRDKYRCKMCGRTKEEVPLEVDHIMPISDGGTDELSNLATLCRDCNRGKSAYHFNDYMMSAKTSMTQKCQDIDYLKGQFVPRHRRPYSFQFISDTLVF
jgi:hypothetical protein